MIPQAVVFDIGKVLLDFDYSRAAQAMAAQSERGADEIGRVLDQSPLLFEYETGKLTTAQFFEQVRGETGFRGGLELFREMFADIFTPIGAVVSIHRELVERGVPTFIFSNTNEMAVAHIRRQFPFFATFKGFVFSYETGAMKPDAPIYEAVERLSGLEGKKLLYIDDRLENVLAGAGRGWQAIHHTLPAMTRAAVLASGLLD